MRRAYFSYFPDKGGQQWQTIKKKKFMELIIMWSPLLPSLPNPENIKQKKKHT